MAEQDRSEEAAPKDAGVTPGQHLLAYVPRLALQDLRQGRAELATPMRAGLLLVDLEQSTRFVVTLTKFGPKGIDALQRILRTWAETLIRALSAVGGEVYQFAGDAILACFAQAPGESDTDLALRVADAGLAMRKGAESVRSFVVEGQTFDLRSRLGAALGDVNRLLLGREDLWMHPLLVGTTLTDAITAEKTALGGELVFHESLARLLSPTQLGEQRGSCFVLLDTDSPPGEHTLPPQDDDEELAPLAARLLHPFLQRRLSQANDVFFAELREVTCVFLRFELGEKDLLSQLPELRSFFAQVQAESLRFGGMLSQTDFTDKGQVLFVVFGAPLAAERQALMATRFCWALMPLLGGRTGLRSLAAGVATGPAYCGNIGGAGRYGYTTLGEVAHLAARLMASCPSGTVRLDANTARSAQKDFSLTPQAEMALKGVSERVATFQLEGPLHGVRDESRARLVGRERELDGARQAIEHARAGRGSSLLLVGEAGIGKSTLSLRITSEARTEGFEVAVGASFSFESFTPFFPWRTLLAELLGVATSLPPEEQRAQLQDLMAPSLVTLLLGQGDEQDPELRGLDARAKRQLIAEGVAHILRTRTQEGPLLLFFEDVHWADQASLELLELLAPRLQEMPVLVLLTARPSDACQRLEALPGLRREDLEQLPPEAALLLLRSHVHFNPPRPDLEARILERGQGNPLFIEATVRSLLHDYAMESGSNEVRIPDELSAVMLPDSVQEVVLSRVDRLDESERAVLKAASVIGRVFSVNDLLALLPEGTHVDAVIATMTRLESAGLTLVESRQPPVGAFKHAVIRDVIYHTLLIGAQQTLHRTLAQHLERQAGPDPRRAAALLALHFVQGADLTQGLRYTLMAARSARAQSANLDASHHFQRALDLLTSPEHSALPRRDQLLHQVRIEHAEVLGSAGRYMEAVQLLSQCMDAAQTEEDRAEVHEGLGRVYQELGDSDKAISSLETTLQLHGRPAPTNLLVLGLATAFWIFMFLVGKDPVPNTVKPDHRQRKQLTTLVSIIRIYYFLDIAKLVWATFAALNLGRKVGSDAELSQAYTYYGTVLAGGGLLGPSRRACEHGRLLAQRGESAAAEGIALSRLGTQATFANELDRAISVHREAVGTLKRLGEVWEVQTGLMLWATSHFLRGDLAVALTLFDEMGDLARQLNAQRHQAWRGSWSPFCRYLMGQTPAERALVELEQAHDISASLFDLANQCAALNHQANIYVRIGDPEGAARAAQRGFRALWNYHVLVPFLQIGLVDCSEAALFALENGATSVPRWRLQVIVRVATAKAVLLGKVYPYLDGPARRIRARRVALNLGPVAARPLLLDAVDRLSRSPNRWEYGVALLDAAKILRDPAIAAQAREVLEALGARAELDRLALIEAELGIRPSARSMGGAA